MNSALQVITANDLPKITPTLAALHAQLAVEAYHRITWRNT